jgi:membrane protein
VVLRVDVRGPREQVICPRHPDRPIPSGLGKLSRFRSSGRSLVWRLRRELAVLSVLRQSARDFLDDEAPVRAAALAYYTIFALPPLLVLLLMVAGLVWDAGDVQRAVETQFTSLLGSEAARTIRGAIEHVDQTGGSNVLRTTLSAAGLVFGATGAFLQLQGALNRAWEVRPDPEGGGVRRFLLKRFLSLGMILGVGFLIAVSLALSALLSMLGEQLGDRFPSALLQMANLAVSMVVLALLFAAIYKVLPDAEIAWKDVMVGAAVTALLFVAGKFAIGLYLGRSSPGEAFGAAGALAVILVWAYYAGMIVLFGAEFTQAWARSRGREIRPEPGAVRVHGPKSAKAMAHNAPPAGAGRPSRSPRITSPAMYNDNDNGRDSRLASRRASAIQESDGFESDGASVGELFRQLSTDASHLMRQEINLARAELRESAGQVARGASRIGMAAGLALSGLMAFTAFLVIAIGDWIGNYWAGALLVSLVMLGIAGILAKRGIAEFRKGSLVPQETAGTLREDMEWAKTETQAFKRAFTAPQPRTH